MATLLHARSFGVSSRAGSGSCRVEPKKSGSGSQLEVAPESGQSVCIRILQTVASKEKTKLEREAADGAHNGEAIAALTELFQKLHEEHEDGFSNATTATGSWQRESPASSEGVENADGLLSRIEEEFKELIPYKGRNVSARPIHFAVWWCAKAMQRPYGVASGRSCERSTETLALQLLLRAGADPMSRAHYQGRGNQTVELGAMHIAAGLGCAVLMQVLFEAATDGFLMVNEYCAIGLRKFYTPLHDAAFCGKEEAAVWLLEHRADPMAQNCDGFTALHWLAYRGLDKEDQVDVIVKALLKAGANLESKTSNDVPDARWRNLTPLQLSVQAGSQFPKQLLHLLSKSYSIITAEQCQGCESSSIFEDTALMSTHSTQAAVMFAKRIRDEGGEKARLKMILDAQRDNAVDCFASLFHMAPEAATEMLDMLMEAPLVCDAGHHPLCGRVILSSFWNPDSTMACAYQPDMKPKSISGGAGSVRWPAWSYDASKASTGEAACPPWHSNFVKVPAPENQRSSDVVDVEYSALLIPNILDIDIFMAISFSPDSALKIFHSRAVRGAVHCLWVHLVSRAFVLNFLLDFSDLVILSIWGLTPVGGGFCERLMLSDADVAPPPRVHWPALYILVLAGFLRDFVNLAWWYHSLCSKWRSHYQSWQEQSGSSSDLLTSVSALLGATNSYSSLDLALAADQLPDDEASKLRSGLHSLWHPRKALDWSGNTLLSQLVVGFSKCVFLILAAPGQTSSHDTTGPMVPVVVLALAVTIALMCWKLIYLLRVSAFSGKKILVLLQTLQTGAMQEILLLAFLIFGAFLLVCCVLSNTWSPIFIAGALYDGMFFQEGIPQLGLAIDPPDPEKNSTLGVPTAAGSPGSLLRNATMIFNQGGLFWFSVLFLQLIVAVFSNTYGQLEEISELLFVKERSKYITMCLLSLQKYHFPDSLETECVVRAVKGGTFIIFLMASATWASCFLRGWGSHPVLILATAALLAASQVSLQALVMQSHWFARQDGAEGPSEEHFLWVCASPHEEEQPTVNSTAKAEEIEHRLRALQEQLDDTIGAMNHKMDLLLQLQKR